MRAVTRAWKSWAALALRHAPELAAKLPVAWRVLRKVGWAGLLAESRRKLRPETDYLRWVRLHDSITPEARRALRERATALGGGPLISVLMPCYDPDPMFLKAAIDSVRAQIHSNWELCIADDASTSAEVRAVLEASQAEDSRIKVVFRPANGHISAASNTALELVTGDWVALMDHDDLLAEDALFWVAECLREHPDARLIYSDEDKVDDQGNRSAPYFKPDWNLDLCRSQNMFSHLGVFFVSLVREVGGFRQGFEGSQDWDLLLRCVERVEAGQIRHIPRVLYHWRIHAQSTSSSMDAKPYAALAGERALDEHFRRLHVNARAEYVNHGYRVHFALPSPPPLVTLIVPTRNALGLLRRCVESIQTATEYPSWELIVMDNGSDDPATLDYLEKIGRRGNVRVLRDDREFNYSALNNRAVAAANGELVALVNNDIEVVSPGWLNEMVSLAVQPGVGAVGARLWYPDMTLQHGGVILSPRFGAVHAHKKLPQGLHGHGGRATLVQSFSAVTAACLVVRRSTYQQIGGLDEVNLKVAFNDVDFCLRLRQAGYRNVWTPYAELLHRESATRGEDVAPEKRERFEREQAFFRGRWSDAIDRDPGYNPNLTADAEDFGLAWPPRHR